MDILKVHWLWWLCPPTFTIICFMYIVIQNPEGAINQFMITIISSVLILFPSTPSNFKVANLLQSIASANPTFGWGVVFEIFQGASGLFFVSLLVRIWKFLPFT
jgi:hypothetical protein